MASPTLGATWAQREQDHNKGRPLLNLSSSLHCKKQAEFGPLPSLAGDKAKLPLRRKHDLKRKKKLPQIDGNVKSDQVVIR